MLELFAELGLVFLLFWVGLETRLSDICEVGREAITVGVGGVAVRRTALREPNPGDLRDAPMRARGPGRGGQPSPATP
jgi:hypothetical protein